MLESQNDDVGINTIGNKGNEIYKNIDKRVLKKGNGFQMKILSYLRMDQ